MAVTALKLVEARSFFEREVALSDSNFEESFHSLHQLVTPAVGLQPEIPAFVIERYSKPENIVLDPFCGVGTTGIEAIVRGRTAWCSDSDPLGARIAAAKLFPCELPEVALFLQQHNPRLPVGLGDYRDIFSPFYDIDTFRELLTLRNLLSKDPSEVSCFVEVVTMGLLHGPSAGYLSVYSYPHISLTPQDQKLLNNRRNQSPDHRAVAPRVLRKTSALLRDGYAGGMRRSRTKNRAEISDASNLNFVPSESVSLIFGSPPIPEKNVSSASTWLRRWFGTIEVEPSHVGPQTEGDWLELMNGFMLEAARIVPSGGVVALDLVETVPGETSELQSTLIEMVSRDLARFFHSEGVYLNYGVGEVKKRSVLITEAPVAPRVLRNRILIFRRK